MKKNVCSKLKFQIEDQNPQWGFGVSAMDGQRQVGYLSVSNQRFSKVHDLRYRSVETIMVDETVRRCGIGTRMYEIAAKKACETGDRLASDRIRSDAAQAFWAKQTQKRRARCVERAKTRVGDQGKGDCAYYVLNSCPPESLAGARRRKR